VPADQLLDAALELANLIATKAPKSIAAVKNVFRAERQSILGAGMLAEEQEGRLCTASEDTKEGLAALREKRAPQFKNK
jgi:enoyl-CoA hydratase/carnithine racemase